MSLRPEMDCGACGLDYQPDFIPATVDLDGLVKRQKKFTGKATTEAQRAARPERNLVSVVIDVDRIDVSNG